MSKYYDSLVRSLNEAIEYTEGKRKLKKEKVTVIPVKTYTASEVKSIRKSTGMSQKLFAEYLGVSNKTVEAWEQGTNHPSGSSSRMLSMMESDKSFVTEHPFVRIDA